MALPPVSEAEHRLFMANKREVDARIERERREQQQAMAEEDARLDKVQHDYKFKKVQAIYKSKSRWERFKLKVKGKVPRWKTVEGYSTEQLQHLLDVREGKMVAQWHTEADRRDRNERYGDKTEREMRQEIDDLRFEQFLAEASSPSRLDRSMKLQEDQMKTSRGRSR